MGAWHVVVERLSEPVLTDVAGRAGAGALNALPTIAGRSRIDALRHSLRSQKQRDSTDGFHQDVVRTGIIWHSLR
jgi:hypothetical protein